MKQYAANRKVVIMQNPGKGNIEQAIFIIREGIVENNDDYILKEARKIVEDFIKEGNLGAGKKRRWIIGALCCALLTLCWFYINKI